MAATVTSNDTELIEEGHKRDGRGWRIAEPRRRDEIVAGYASSGLTQKAYSRQEGVNYHTLVSWLGRSRRESAEPGASAPRFAQLSWPAGRAVCRLAPRGRPARRRHPARRRSRRVARPAQRARAPPPVLSFPAGFKIFLALEPTDMRKQFNGLWAAAATQLREDPRQGAVFVFANREPDRIKLLYWNGTGVWVLAKRLEKGRFSWPRATGAKLALAPAELTLLLSGIDLEKTSENPGIE